MDYKEFADENEVNEVQQQLKLAQIHSVLKAKDIIMSEVQQIEQNLQRQDSKTSEKNAKDKEKEDMIKQLVMMGYDMDVVEFAGTKMEYRSLEAVIEFLSKGENGLYNHQFVQSQGDLCYLCHELIDVHIKLIERADSSRSFQNLELIKEKSAQLVSKLLQEEFKSEKGNGKLCPVCFENKNDYFCLNNCKHEFCIDCTKEQLKVYINESRVLKIKCFQIDCQEVFQQEDIKVIFKDENDFYVKYQRFINMKLVDTDPLKKWCPRPGCDKYVSVKDSNVIKAICDCGQEVCFQCGNPFHGRKSCNSLIDDQFNQWVGHSNVRYCPKCKAKIEKSEGCNHMTCFYCQFQFCWICGETYTRDHFSPLNPLGCSGQQYRQQGPQNFLKVLLRRIGIFILLIIAAPFVLVLAAPIACGATCWEASRNFRRLRSFVYLRLIIIPIFVCLGVVLGLISNIIVIPVAILIGIPILIFMNIKERVERHRAANEQLAYRLQQRAIESSNEPENNNDNNV